MNRGVILAVSAYLIWGVHPFYWKQLQYVHSYEIVAHRIFWSFMFFLVIMTIQKNWGALFRKIKTSPNQWMIFMPALLIGSNWGMYVWAVNSGHIIETSLGYFICPILSVFLGVLFLYEKLKRMQWAAVWIASLGVLVMTVFYGQFPWIALYLAVSWGTYGLLRKKSPLNSAEGLALETALLSIPALAFLVFRYGSGISPVYVDLKTSLLLAGTGFISGLPLMMFIVGARLIRFSLIGILQFFYPTMILLIGYFVYHESMTEAKLIGFIFIWIAIVIYISQSEQFRRRGKTKD